ncbi:MAG: hypothetical protein ACC726_14130, partial [Chloroflexota bacterium]
MPVHLRQFLIGPEPRLVRPDWRSTALSPGIHLSHCPTLPLRTDAAGMVLGDAIASGSGADGPRTWAGRWVLLSGTRLQMDAGGLLGCFFRSSQTGFWVSSSPEILRELSPELPLHADRLERDWRLMDWYPPPHSAIAGIGRLLPSQVLQLTDGSVAARSLPGVDAGAAYEDILDRAGRRLVAAANGAAAVAAQQAGRIWVGLTGGRDSRLVLAAAVAAGVKPMTYTFIRAKTSPGDRELPPRLAAALGLEHIQIPMVEVDPQKASDFDRHTAFGFVGGARTQYSTGGWDRVESSAVALEGGCFEFARGYYYGRLPSDMGGKVSRVVADVTARFPTGRPAGVEAWADWILGAGRQADLDWRDRFYLEQRMGGWLSAGLQGFDISARRQIHIANCDALLADLLNVPLAERRAGTHEAALVERLAPALAAFPYNPGSGGRSKGSGTQGKGRRASRSLLDRIRGASERRSG